MSMQSNTSMKTKTKSPSMGEKYLLGSSESVFELSQTAVRDLGAFDPDRVKNMLLHAWTVVGESKGDSLKVNAFIPAGSALGNKLEQVKFLGFITKQDASISLGDDDVDIIMQHIAEEDIDRMVTLNDLASLY